MGYHSLEDCYKTVIQTTSVHNNRVERLWREVNKCVMYPLKNAIVDMIHRFALDKDDLIYGFSVSQVIARVAAVALDAFVAAWNVHHIQRK